MIPPGNAGGLGWNRSGPGRFGAGLVLREKDDFRECNFMWTIKRRKRRQKGKEKASSKKRESGEGLRVVL